MTETNIVEQALEREQLREELRVAHRQLARAKDKTAALTEAAFDGALSAVRALGKPTKITPPRRSTKRGKREAALWHLSDWQGAKLTTSYNSQVMQERVMAFCAKAASITNIQRADHPVDDCVIALGGDMIEGLFNFPTQPYEIDATLYEQYVTVARLIERVARFAAQTYNHVSIIGEAGNHGRLGSKRDAVPRSDNADRMTYRLAEAMCADIENVSWTNTEEDIQRIEIGNYRALLIHGDEFGRGGFASPATIVRHCDRWRSGAYNWDFRDVYVGHYHNHLEMSMANGLGAVYQTGSTESDNRYARDTMSASAVPSQRLHFIDPAKGRVTSQYKILLAEVSDLGVEHTETRAFRRVVTTGAKR